MALTLRATVNYTTNGTQTVYAFNYDYLRASFIKIKMDGVTTYIYGQDYIISERQLEFTSPPPAGHTLTIYRQTPTDRLVAFTEGSVLKATDLSTNQIQTIHVLEETLDTIYQTSMSQNTDGNWDGQGKRIVNVKDPLNEQDVVTYQFLKAYASFGDTGLDPEDIKKLLSGVGENKDNIETLEKALVTVKNSIPIKISELTNDDFTVKDENYVHTDNNLTDQRTEIIDTLKEVTRLEFSTSSPFWEGNTLTLNLTDDSQTYIALYKLTDKGYALDITTPCYQQNKQIIIEAPAPFNGYVMVSGTIAYGDLNELLGIILNESVVYTYTLEDILGEPYKEPVFPDKTQMEAMVAALENCANTLRVDFADKLVSANTVLGQVKDYYDAMYNLFGGAFDPSIYATAASVNHHVETLTAKFDNYVLVESLVAYATKEYVDSTLLPYLKYQIVTELPTEQAEGVLYIVTQ